MSVYGGRMKRNRVFSHKRSGHTAPKRRGGCQKGYDVQKKTIEYMEELGRIGHWVYDYRSRMVLSSNGAKDIFKSDDRSKYVRYDKSMLNQFDERSRQELYEMSLSVKKSGVP